MLDNHVFSFRRKPVRSVRLDVNLFVMGVEYLKYADYHTIIFPNKEFSDE